MMGSTLRCATTVNSKNWEARTLDGILRFFQGDHLALALVVITAVGILILAVVVLMSSSGPRIPIPGGF